MGERDEVEGEMGEMKEREETESEGIGKSWNGKMKEVEEVGGGEIGEKKKELKRAGTEK